MNNNAINENALKAVPMMEELSDESLREMMGGGPCGNWCTYTCECGCGICTSIIYSCTRSMEMQMA